MVLGEREDEILETVTGHDAHQAEVDSEEYTEESVGYTRSFVESVSADYGNMPGFGGGEEAVVYEHADGRHVWINYGEDSVNLSGDELTVSRCEDILASERPEIAYFRNRGSEGKSRVKNAVENFSGLFKG